MKTLIYTSIVAVLLLGSSVVRAQQKSNEYLGLPGDNLNLYAVMNLFQESETLEGFEKSLNDPEKMVNNLDLNSDNKVDYIMVLDYNEENIHNIVLRVAINKDENQDVAVFIVEKRNDGSARVQLIGDEILYGKDYIIEPAYAETPNPGYNGNVSQKTETVVTTTYYEVARWPLVVYVYEPSYVVWTSSWYWGCYTPYWHSWTPHYWHYYHGYHYNWHSHYHAYYRHRRPNHHGGHYHGHYAHNRRHSNTVTTNIHSGRYANTYSRPDRKEDGNRHFTNKFPTGIAEKPLNNNQNRPIAIKPNRVTKPDETGRTTVTNENDRRPVREKPQVTDRPVREINATKPARNRLSDPARTEERPATRPSVPARTEERPATRPSTPARTEERPATRPSTPARTEERPATRPERPSSVSVPSQPRRDNSNSSSGSNSRPAVRESSSSHNVQNSNGGSAPRQSSPSGSSSPKSNKSEGRKR